MQPAWLPQGNGSHCLMLDQTLPCFGLHDINCFLDSVLVRDKLHILDDLSKFIKYHNLRYSFAFFHYADVLQASPVAY